MRCSSLNLAQHKKASAALSLLVCYVWANVFLFDNKRAVFLYANVRQPEVNKSCQANFGLKLCRPEDRRLSGTIVVNTSAVSWTYLDHLYPEVEAGGRWRPPSCRSCDHVAIVIPYRDRDDHLRTYLRHMHPILQRQLLDYGIYVIEQDNSSLFNRGMLMNIGFVEALKADNYNCFVFSDVDLLPENDRNLYGCPEQPRHLSVSVDTHGYKLFYEELFGGVENFRTEHFSAINGFSNMYFGWGGEDDDLYNRITHRGLILRRPPTDVARYTMNRHRSNEQSESGSDMLRTWKLRSGVDGLNNLQYDIVRYDKRPLYTLISVVIDKDQVTKTVTRRIDREVLLRTLRNFQFM